MFLLVFVEENPVIINRLSVKEIRGKTWLGSIFVKNFEPRWTLDAVNLYWVNDMFTGYPEA